MSEPLFSIITVVRNAQNTVRETVESVLCQTCTDYEYIVIDGQSTDGTLEILEVFRSRFDYFVSEPDSGIYDAMNKGLEQSKGMYVLYLNADDIIASPVSLELVKKSLRSQVSFPSALTTHAIVDFGSFHVTRDHSFSTRRLRNGDMPSHQGFFVKRKTLVGLGGFDMSYRSSSDFDFMCRFLALKPTVVQANIVFSIVRANGVSSNKELSTKETQVIVRKHFGLTFSLIYAVRKRFAQTVIKRFLERLLPPRIFLRLRQYNTERIHSGASFKTEHSHPPQGSFNS